MLLEVALGELNLHPWEFDEYTMEQFVIKAEGLRKTKVEQWHHTRVIAFTIARPNLKNKNMTMEQYWPLPGDKGYEKRSRFKRLNLEERRKAVDAIRQKFIDQGLITDN